MTSLADRTAEFLRAPVGATMFVLAGRHGLTADDLADPATVTAMASGATAELNPWFSSPPPAGVRARMLELAAPLDDLAGRVLADPRNAWWSAPLDRSAQLLLTDQPSDPSAMSVPVGPADGWEIYAQKPLDHLCTSTELPVPAGEPIRSGAHAQLCCGVSDWSPTYPVRQTRLTIADSARIHEVHSAADWHDLAVRYGDVDRHPGPDANLLRCAGIDHGVAPTWSAAAHDLDGVHLSLAGLLTALYTPVTHDGVTTTLWGWQWESTYWLRPAFTSATALPDLSEAPESPRIPWH